MTRIKIWAAGIAAAMTLPLVATSTAAAAPALAAAPENAASYIVQTNSAASSGGMSASVAAAGGEITNTYSTVFSGFSALLTPEQVATLSADPQVVSVTPDAPMTVSTVQNDPDWGLDRIDQRAAGGDTKYTYDSTGSGVTVFVVDTGIRLTHTDFGGRATSGYDFVDNDTNASDCNGHGTHVAGTVGGTTFGVAKAVKLVSVRVFDCNGEGSFSDFVAGIDWVIAHKPAGPSVVNFSGGGGIYEPAEQAVKKAVTAGIPVVISAGNNNADACGESPARVAVGITVGSSDYDDVTSRFSNWGTCLDLYAPGEDITSASVSSDTASELMSGTSMAAPHVAGIAARYLQSHATATPAQVASAIVADGTKNALTDPSLGQVPFGGPNVLAYAAPGSTVTVASVPTSLVATKNDTAKSATLTWAAPSSNGGSAITGYRVSRDGTDAKGVGPWSTVVSATARSQTFTSLKAGSTYKLSVQAITAAGNGALGSKSITLAAAVALPGKPVIGTAVGGVTTDTVISVTGKWQPPTTGGAVTGYKVTTVNQTTGARKTVTATATARSIQITGLRSGYKYAVEVVATNAAGSGAASTKSNIVTAK